MLGVLEISHLSLPLGLAGSSAHSLAHSGSQEGFAGLSGESPTQRGEFKLEESGRECGLANPILWTHQGVNNYLQTQPYHTAAPFAGRTSCPYVDHCLL